MLQMYYLKIPYSFPVYSVMKTELQGCRGSCAYAGLWKSLHSSSSNEINVLCLKDWYYHEKMLYEQGSELARREVALSYVHGLVWLAAYYMKGIYCWNYCYSENYGPCLSDIEDLSQIESTFMLNIVLQILLPSHMLTNHWCWTDTVLGYFPIGIGRTIRNNQETTSYTKETSTKSLSISCWSFLLINYFHISTSPGFCSCVHCHNNNLARYDLVLSVSNSQILLGPVQWVLHKYKICVLKTA